MRYGRSPAEPGSVVALGVANVLDVVLFR